MSRLETASMSPKSPHPIVLSQVHVSCFITAANRATPVFEVVPERHCVRVVNKPLGDTASNTAASTNIAPENSGSSNSNGSWSSSHTAVPSAEWDFHMLFPSASSSHASDFYREITQPAFRNVCDGWNTNVVAWGVHPTQKFRLLFGKSTGGNDFLPGSGQPSSSPSAAVDREILEVYGQLGALLCEFFHLTSPRRMSSTIRAHQPSLSSSGWRLGISGWIVVNNQAIDLLKPAVSPSTSSRKAGQSSSSSSGQQPAPLSFVSLEAKSFASACKILQIAKTNRIVMKQHAEHAHFFLRLAFFHNGQPYIEALEKAHIPSRVLSPPNVEGLDAATATKIQATDAALLRKNYDTLLTIVQEQQHLREAAEARAAEAVHDLEEVRASFEVQVGNLKLANVALRSKVRSLEKQSALPRVFEQYEQELQSLLKEVQQLRDRNVGLELKMTENDGCSGPGSVHDLKKRYQATMDEKQQLEKQLLEYRKKERQFLVHSKLVGDSTRRVDQLSRELTNKEEALVAAKLGKLRLNAEMNQAHEEAELLHQENEKLLVEKAAATEELLATKMYLVSIENEQRKADILDKFVKKHGDRMSRLKSKADSSSSSRSGSESWRRDAAARECEDRVFATVKRSIPQLVPLVNKMLRRLEMQELALREYSDREIDFIHLLIELVSDQPALSLKNMIHAEMQKLS
uniref:Uncharacterized protein n=1 Tax=Globisporangium ultimum (strain ATCC 200006 / CBS 805.95 / DAOM BR144) TaxID=431595 RepID=K3WGT2_GLOUD